MKLPHSGAAAQALQQKSQLVAPSTVPTARSAPNKSTLFRMTPQALFVEAGGVTGGVAAGGGSTAGVGGEGEGVGRSGIGVTVTGGGVGTVGVGCTTGGCCSGGASAPLFFWHLYKPSFPCTLR